MPESGVAAAGSAIWSTARPPAMAWNDTIAGGSGTPDRAAQRGRTPMNLSPEQIEDVTGFYFGQTDRDTAMILILAPFRWPVRSS
jgi:hypothetical protein